jgi:hypothetical protein
LQRLLIDRRQRFGAFGEMAFAGCEPAHPIRAETLPQCIDQTRALLGAVTLCGG